MFCYICVNSRLIDVQCEYGHFASFEKGHRSSSQGSSSQPPSAPDAGPSSGSAATRQPSSSSAYVPVSGARSKRTPCKNPDCKHKGTTNQSCKKGYCRPCCSELLGGCGYGGHTKVAGFTHAATSAPATSTAPSTHQPPTSSHAAGPSSGAATSLVPSQIGRPATQAFFARRAAGEAAIQRRQDEQELQKQKSAQLKATISIVHFKRVRRLYACFL